ncbi:MAG: hypothetical protein LBI96_00875 [Odoribacteraceae bacterium]|nr:hypothetical protein [Odoribacteraceae bacterium]
MFKFLLTIGLFLCSVAGMEGRCGSMTAANKLDDLLKQFEANPADASNTMQLLKELKLQGKPNDVYLQRYFQTQNEADYVKAHNWSIIRDYIEDVNAPQIKYVLDNQSKFIQNFSRDDVFQKLDNIFVGHLEKYYGKDQTRYGQYLEYLKSSGYEHYDVVSDYFYIKQLRAERKSEDYFYKARKLFRYFPENRQMIKEITDGALEIMNDVSRLKVIQLWAGKTVEVPKDFEAVYNYALISEKCGFRDIAKKYASVANNLAIQAKDKTWQEKAQGLLKIVF